MIVSTLATLRTWWIKILPSIHRQEVVRPTGPRGFVSGILKPILMVIYWAACGWFKNSGIAFF